jgi:Ni/Co efflux regulator RcnB
MAATYQRQKIGRSLVIALMLASGGAQAEKPERDGPGRDQPGAAQQEGGWRDYYREREQREKHERTERAVQDRAWNDYYQQRQKQGYPSPQPGVTVDIRIGGYFGYPQRVEVDRYYADQARKGHCPPGLAKKVNGCLPPGQAKAWTLGRPLPSNIGYYPIEPAVRVRLGPPPAGHEFIRIASDILLIAIGTGMVIDAIEDLGRR